MVAELREMRRAVSRAYGALPPPRSNFSSGEFVWAVSIVHSRAFTVPLGGSGEEDSPFAENVLMPYMDIINHHHDNNADWMSLPVEGGRLRIEAKRNIRRGEEVYVSFGPRPNDNLFLYYGFVLEDNPFDSVLLFGSFQESVRWLLAALCRPPGGGGPRRCGRQVPFPEAWAAARAALEGDAGALVAAAVAEADASWQRLTERWAALGYEYLPYRRLPAVRAGGIVDPGLMAVFAAVAELHLQGGGATCRAVRMPPVALERALQGDESVRVAAPPGGFARAAVARRCREVLGRLPSSIEEDEAILLGPDRCRAQAKLGRGGGARRGPVAPPGGELLAVAVRFRLEKKRLLRAAAEGLENSGVRVNGKV